MCGEGCGTDLIAATPMLFLCSAHCHAVCGVAHRCTLFFVVCTWSYATPIARPRPLPVAPRTAQADDEGDDVDPYADDASTSSVGSGSVRYSDGGTATVVAASHAGPGGGGEDGRHGNALQVGPGPAAQEACTSP